MYIKTDWGWRFSSLSTSHQSSIATFMYKRWNCLSVWFPISKTIQVRWTRHAGHCWRKKVELIKDILLWTSKHGHTSVGQPGRTYLHQLCVDTVCRLEDLPRPIDDRDGWRVRESSKSMLLAQLNFSNVDLIWMSFDTFTFYYNRDYMSLTKITLLQIPQSL